MKGFVLAIVLLLAGGGTTYAAHHTMYDTDFALSRKNFVMTMPIEVERDQVFLPVTIGGRSYRFKLDTGASQGVLYDDVPLDGLKELGFIKSKDATGQSRQVKTVELPPMTLDSLTISGFKVQLMHRNVRHKGEDGIIGFALFHRGLAACIDVRQRQLTLTDRKNYYKEVRGEVLKYSLKMHVPWVRVSPFEGTEEEVLFDSGSPMLYAVNSESLAQMEARVPAVKEQIEGTTFGSRAMGHFGSEHSSKITLLALKRLQWGNFQFQDVHCATVKGGSHVGAQLFKYGSLVINPFRKQLVFQPYDDATSCVVANNRPDIMIVEKEGKAMIGVVMEQGRAWEAGFRQGQIIEKVNGRSLSFDEFTAYRWVRGQEYDFTLRLPVGVNTTLRALWPLSYNKKKQ